MMNTYGITEGGGGCTVALYDEDILRKAGAIGQPTPFMDVKIVDTEGKELPSGSVGELLLKGPRLMKEYAFNAELTARTITDGWLHTGDLAYKDQDGFLFFADRTKDLIIRGGENIFPAEIEDALRKHPKIQDVAVIGYPHRDLWKLPWQSSSRERVSPLRIRKLSRSAERRGLQSISGPRSLSTQRFPVTRPARLKNRSSGKVCEGGPGGAR